MVNTRRIKSTLIDECTSQAEAERQYTLRNEEGYGVWPVKKYGEVWVVEYSAVGG